MLKNARIIAKKEIKLLFKSPRRILLLLMTPAIILLIFLSVLFFAAISDQSIPGPLSVIIIQDDAGFDGFQWGETFYSMLKEHSLTKEYNYINKSVLELESLREAKNITVLVYIPANFSELISRSNVTIFPEPASFHLYYNSENTANVEAVTNISTVGYQLNLILVYMENGPVKLTRVTTAYEDTAGDQLASLLTGYLTMIPLYAIFLLVLPSLTLVLISVTIEREQKTLESLLLQPLERRNIISGKLLYGLLLVLFNVSSLVFTLVVILAGILIILPADMRTQAGELIVVLLDTADITAWLFIIYMIFGLILISILLVAAAVLFSMLAKDEREANMVVSSFILLPLLGVTFMGFIPLDKLPAVIQSLLLVLPLMGYMFGIYMAILTGDVTVITWLTLVSQAVWIGIIIWFAGRVIENEGILDISMKRVLLGWRKKK
ncbi:MAG: ABC transporter permease [Candidatus Hodarchaeales archaeon]|jgi:ABC-type Na+ efflux pump permease subunit